MHVLTRYGKKSFIEDYLCMALQQADIDVLRLRLIDDDHVEVFIEGGGKRVVNIACDNRKAIIMDILKVCK